MTDRQLQEMVLAELDWEPGVRAAGIGVSVHDRVVTLSGFVDSYVEKFDAEVRVSRGAETVGGTSIMGLMMLAASPGTSITVEASGRDAAAVIAALEDLLGRRFGEDE